MSLLIFFSSFRLHVLHSLSNVQIKDIKNLVLLTSPVTGDVDMSSSLHFLADPSDLPEPPRLHFQCLVFSELIQSLAEPGEERMFGEFEME